MRRIEELYEKYLSGTISHLEREKLFAEIKSANDFDLQMLADKFLNRDTPSDLRELENDTDQLFKEIKQRIEHTNQSKTVWLWPRLVAAIAVLFAVGAGIIFFMNWHNPIKNGETHYLSDVPPGKAGATLTLGNGKKINLGDVQQGGITTESGISISKTSDSQIIYQVNSSLREETKQSYNTLSTARGETYILTLPDKTQVWLNAASSLTYGVSFAGTKERRVKLTGEAYFQVAKDKTHPFIVETARQEVKVLGTHFNINTYNTNQTITTLEEGSVLVSSLTPISSSRGTKQSLFLQPGEQSVNGERLTKEQADMESALAWKNGLLFFRDAPLPVVLDEVSRWYDVEIKYRGELKNKVLSGGINRTANLSAMQKILKLTGVNTKLVSVGTRRILIVEL